MTILNIQIPYTASLESLRNYKKRLLQMDQNRPEVIEAIKACEDRIYLIEEVNEELDEDKD